MAVCRKVAGGTLTILVNGSVIGRATGNWTLHLNTVIRTPIDGGGGFVTEEVVSPGGEGQFIDDGNLKLKDVQQICNATIIVTERSGRITVFTGATYIEAMDKNVNEGTYNFQWTADDYTEQLPAAA